MADNASAQFRNPALLSYLADTQVSADGIYVNPNVDIDGQNSSTGPTSTDDVAHDAVIPNFYFSHQLDDRLTAGIALATNFGMETDLGNDFTGTQFGNEAAVTTFEINQTLPGTPTSCVLAPVSVMCWGKAVLGRKQTLTAVWENYL